MSAFDLPKSMERARRRLGDPTSSSGRAPRSDRGGSRLPPDVIVCVREAMAGQERPAMRVMLADVEERCRGRGLRPPSRATVYKLMATIPTPSRRVADLPRAVRAALYNLEPESDVPEHQIAFYCFNYGDLEAVSFASGLPWLALHQALRLPGHRRKSRGLIEAVARVRGI